MKNEHEITLFGHTVPKEVYEDYQSMEKLKDKIVDLLSDPKLLENDEQSELRDLLFNVEKLKNKIRESLNNSNELKYDERVELKNLLSTMSEKCHKTGLRRYPPPPSMNG